MYKIVERPRSADRWRVYKRRRFFGWKLMGIMGNLDSAVRYVKELRGYGSRPMPRDMLLLD